MISVAGAQVISGFRFGFAQPCVIFKVDTPQDLQMPPGTEKRLLQAVSDALPPREDLSGPVEGSDSRHRLLSLSARICAVMQDSVGVPVTHASRILPLPGGTEISSWMVALPALDPNATRFAFHEVIALLDVCLADPAKQRLTQAERDRFDDTLDKVAKFAPGGSNTPGFLREALKSGIPITRLPGGAWQYGWGAKARVFNSSLSDATPALGAGWAKNKSETNQLLRMAGLPVAQQAQVTDLEDALRKANEIGYPVVIKAADLDQGKGVEAGLQNETELSAAFARVQSHGRKLLLEQHVDGMDVRVNILKGRYLTAAARTPAAVVGNGADTIRDLVTETNRDPRRSTHKSSPMRPILLNEEAHELLASQGMNETSVPDAGMRVQLRRAANVSSGGEIFNIADSLHPDNAALSEKAARCLRLDIAGVDLLLPDPAKSWRDTGGAICEVNAQPQINATVPPIYQDFFRAYLDGQARVPVIFLLTDDAKTAAAVRATMPAGNIHVVDDLDTAASDPGTPLQERLLTSLIDPQMTACIIVSDAREVLQNGVPVDRLDALWVGKWQGSTDHLARRIGMLAQQVTGRIALLDDRHKGNPALREISKAKPVERISLTDAVRAFSTAQTPHS